MSGPYFANDMTVLGQIVFTQNLHHVGAVLRCNLNHHAQLFIEQGLERELFASRANLLCPVLGITIFGATVTDAISLRDQQVHIEGHTHLTRKTHFCHSAEQAAI